MLHYLLCAEYSHKHSATKSSELLWSYFPIKVILHVCMCFKWADFFQEQGKRYVLKLTDSLD